MHIPANPVILPGKKCEMYLHCFRRRSCFKKLLTIVAIRFFISGGKMKSVCIGFLCFFSIVVQFITADIIPRKNPKTVTVKIIMKPLIKLMKP